MSENADLGLFKKANEIILQYPTLSTNEPVFPH